MSNLMEQPFSVLSGRGPGGGLRAARVPGVLLRAAAARHGGLRRREHRLRARREGAQRRVQGEARRAAPHRRQALQPLRLARPAPVPGMPFARFILSFLTMCVWWVLIASMMVVRYLG